MMSRQFLKTSSYSIAALSLIALMASVGHAQCGGCEAPALAPTVAYSPVAVAAPVTPVAPVVYQSAVPTPRSGWYPGKFIGQLFGGIGSVFSPRPAVPPSAAVVPPTFTTAAYSPTYPPSYSVGYAPTAYTAGYAPSAYSVGYAPASYAAVQQTVAYPSPTVTLSPVNDCCCGSSACSACSGAVTAGYSAPLGAPAGGCANCQGGAPATYEQSAVYQQPAFTPPPQPQPGFQAPAGPGYPQPTPAPQLPQNDNTPEQRQSFRPDSNPLDVDKSNYDLNNMDDTTSYFQAPELFNPRDRTTRRPSATTAPVWNAVYQQPESRQTRQTAYRTAKPVGYEQPARNKQVGASGWRSSSN